MRSLFFIQKCFFHSKELVLKGEYSKNSDKFLREIRRYYHFYNDKETGWKLYMIAGADTED